MVDGGKVGFVTNASQPKLTGTTPGLPDDAFIHDGLITKRHVRATALAYLRPSPRALLWDLGTGSGAISIEWALSAPGARAIGIEAKPARLERAQTNAATFEVQKQVEFKLGRSEQLIAELPRPDAIFIGGGATAEIIEDAWVALATGGRFVVHAVTLETEQILFAAYRLHGGELSRLTVETAEPIGNYLGWKPLRPVVQWSVIKG